ncbi:MAG: phosphatidate cytidylyltransferase [Pseudomonadota bacterium]
MASSELKTRVMSAVILGIAVLFITWWSAESFALMCALGGVVVMREWRALTRMRPWYFAPLGIVYIGAAFAALVYVRYENIAILWSLFAIVWSGDVAAYFVGQKFGTHKIAPRISPGKSWEGLAGAIVVSAAVAAVLGRVAPVPHAILGGLFAIMGLAGDMFESSLKRRAGVKDSGSLIPGHGGLFDRVDALLPCAIFAAAALYIRLHVQ